MTFVFRYDPCADNVIIDSPITGNSHSFSRESLDDLIDWLKSDRHRRETWGLLMAEYRYSAGAIVVISCLGDGKHVDFLAFDADHYLEEVDMFETAVRDVQWSMLKQAKELREQGKTPEEIMRQLNGVQVLEMPAVWKAEDAR